MSKNRNPKPKYLKTHPISPISLLTKSLRTLLSHPEKYHVGRAIKFGDYNIGEKDNLLTLPTYMAFLLTQP